MAAGKLDIDANRSDVLLGQSVPRAGGMNVYDPPHLIGANEFQRLENARWDGTSMVPRGGQSKDHASIVASGYALWGMYGGHMGHGGVGGIGFKDTPAGETPAAFAGGGALTEIWGEPCGDAALAYAYSPVRATNSVTGSRAILIYRWAKPFAGVPNIIYRNGAGRLAAINLSTGSTAELGVTGGYDVVGAVVVATLPVSSGFAANFFIHYAEAGIVWLRLDWATTTEFWKIDTTTGLSTLVKTYAEVTSSGPRWWKMGGKLYGLFNRAAIGNFLTYAPDFPTEVTLDSGFRFQENGIVVTPNTVPLGQNPVYGGFLYLVGTNGTNTEIRINKVTPLTMAQALTTVESPGGGAIGYFLFQHSGLLYISYNNGGFGHKVATWNGSSISVLGSSTNPGFGPGQYSGSRLYTYHSSGAGVSPTKRSASGDFLTAFSDFGTASGVSGVPTIFELLP